MKRAPWMQINKLIKWSSMRSLRKKNPLFLPTCFKKKSLRRREWHILVYLLFSHVLMFLVMYLHGLGDLVPYLISPYFMCILAFVFKKNILFSSYRLPSLHCGSKSCLDLFIDLHTYLIRIHIQVILSTFGVFSHLPIFLFHHARSLKTLKTSR